MKPRIQCSVWNVGSINNKVIEVMTVIADNGDDVVLITETWLRSDKNSMTATVKDFGYNLIHCIRDDPDRERGRGVGILCSLSHAQANEVKIIFFV